MFLPWSFLAINVVLALFQFSLVSAVSYILAIYSRFGGKYANSIRWVRQGGYLEMYNTLVNSRESLPNTTKFIFVSTIFLSFAASIVDVGALYFVKPTGQLRNLEPECITSDQFSPFDVRITFDGWTKFVRIGSNITEAMVLMINDPNRIPNPIPGNIYKPQLTNYDVGCDSLRFNMGINDDVDLPLRQSGCAGFKYTATGAFESKNVSRKVVNLSSNRFSITSQIFNPPSTVELTSQLELNYSNSTCISGEGLPFTTTDLTRANQYTSTPTTFITKCVLPSYEVVTLSSTLIKIAANSTQNLIALTPMFKTNELGIAMIKSLKKMNATKPAIYSEVTIGKTSLEVISCIPLFADGGNLLYITCTYSSAMAIVTASQQINQRISKARGNDIPEIAKTASVSMILNHTPNVNVSGTQQLSVPEAIEATSTTAHYFASLGQNFDTAWNESKLHVVYDISYIKAGFEVPLWLCIILPTLTLICTGFCVLTHYILDPVYTGSLYKVMSLQLAPRSRSFAPMIRWSKVYSMDNEGFRFTPGNSTHFEPDQKSNTKITRMTQARLN
ncbi:hypothetical protein BGZ76_003810 [Entomortierella beljakovae]|nr:hypothetical protein BGZ76_003810 [Entomortierella beljakovae]